MLDKLDPRSIYNEISRRAKEIGLTVSDLCEKANVSKGTVSNWKSGKANPSTSIIRKLHQAVGIGQ